LIFVKIQLFRLYFNKGLLVTNCTAAQIEFPAFKRRKIEAQFSGGAITSDGGVLFFRAIAQQLELTERIAKQIRIFLIKLGTFSNSKAAAGALS
jgi:hypothetical protein